MMLLLLFLLLPAVSSELVHVHVIFRHGDRSPVIIYPSDPHGPAAWPDGLGALTPLGMRQHFRLGQLLRRRYDSFLDRRYNHTQLFVRSTDVDRTLMSGESNLAGLFLPATAADQFEPGLRWNPIPIHTVPNSDDALLYGGVICPRVDQLMAAVYASESVQEVVRRNAEFLTFLSEKAGMTVNISNLWSIPDTCICEKAHNMSWSDWITPVVWEKMTTLDTYAWNLRWISLELRRLRGGVLLYKILNHLQALSRSPPAVFTSGSKMIMYSSHDFTVSDLMNSAHIPVRRQPPYAAAVLVELHREAGQFLVRFFYHNQTGEPVPISVEGCESACPVAKLLSLLKEETLFPADYTDFCRVHKAANIERDLSFAFSVVFGAGVCFVLLLIVAYIVRQGRHRRYRLMNTQADEEGKM